MKAPETETDEARALFMVLHILGPVGRSKVREHILKLCDREDNFTNEARHTLNILNQIEHGFDVVAR